MTDLYRDDILAIYKNPTKLGKLESYDMILEGNNGSCGDSIKIYIKLEGDKIDKISFEGKGCVISIVSTDLLLQYIEGKNIKEIQEIEEKDMYILVGIDLSNNPSRKKCMMLPLETLRKLTTPDSNSL